MGYHYFRIEAETDGFCFKLYPPNSNSNPMGISNHFPTRTDAEKGLESFKFLVKSTPDIHTLFALERDGKYIKYKLLENPYGIDFCNNGGYEQKSRLKQSLDSIQKHIDARLLDN